MKQLLSREGAVRDGGEPGQRESCPLAAPVGRELDLRSHTHHGEM